MEMSGGGVCKAFDRSSRVRPTRVVHSPGLLHAIPNARQLLREVGTASLGGVELWARDDTGLELA